MPLVCAACRTQMPDISSYCPNCGRLVKAAAGPANPRAPGRSGEKLLGAAAYVLLLPAIVFLLAEPFKRKPFLRFHAFQSLLFAAAGTVVGFLVYLLVIPSIGLLALLFAMVAVIGWIILWLVLLVKALQGEWFELPLIGNWAVRLANHS